MNENLEIIGLLSKIYKTLKAGQRKISKISKEWYPISIIIQIPLSTTEFTLINNNSKDFPFAYLFHSLELRSETNNLAKIKIKINGLAFPLQAYLIDATSNFSQTTHESYYSLNTESKIFPFKYESVKPMKIEILGLNTHTANQKVYITFNGWKLAEKETS